MVSKHTALGALALFLFAGVAAHAGTMGLRWDPVTAPDLAGYRVFYGTAPGVYGQSVDVGQVTQTTLTGLDSCTVWYTAVKARTTAGLLSQSFSNQVSGWPRPELASADPADLPRGSRTTFALNGDNFRPGSTVSFSGSGLTLVSAGVDSCNRMTVTVDVAANAPLGAVAVRVVHPDNVFGEAPGVLQVVSDSSGPAISGFAVSNVGATTATVSWTTDEPANARVRFRRPGESVWQTTELDPTLATTHQVALTGLAPQTTYEVRADSADAGGNSTQSSPATFTTGANAFAYIALEAEWWPLAPAWTAPSAQDAFAGGYLQLSSTANPGTAGSPTGQRVLDVTLPRQATWRFWYRLSAGPGGGDGWFEAVDGGGFQAVQPPAGSSGWVWVEGRSYTLAAGAHAVALGGFEPGARIDRVLVTDDAAFEPSTGPNGDVAAPGAPTGATATAGDGNVALSWTAPSAADTARIVVRWTTAATAPAHPSDGQALVDQSASPGGAGGSTHSGLTNGTTYRYAIFALDGAGNVSAAAVVSATPVAAAQPPDDVSNLTRTDTQN